MTAKTIEQIKKEFLFSGMTISQWSKVHGYPYHSVQQVLSGKSNCSRGKTHEIAVLLGLKEGEIVKN
ncbi:MULTISPECIES: DNA-binding protein [Gilliamella]|uniref:DNA-binding protein n=1 Tax=Gilliamella apicola TaxID=1196095 RepID=A0A556SC29_9GAMM|nr:MULTISPECIES: DNA-binding protein [Gilliamella]MBI0095229.1 DNA-binding protein [Gilliamella sp. W8136]TSJ98702.1 DNA-binding protein [Gilliamella apicola]